MAHSPLTSSSPADGAVITQAPDRLSFSFDGGIRLTKVEIKNGTAEPIQIDILDRTEFARDYDFPFHSLGPGQYEIIWRGLARDGHAMSGAFGFVIE